MPTIFTKAIKITKTVLIFIASILSIYLIIMFSFGGYGKKPITLKMPSNPDSLFLIAHRGLGNYFPESGRSSIRAAQRVGFKAVEVDVEKTLDRQLIIFHDRDCERLLGVKAHLDTIALETVQAFPLIFQGRTSTDFVMTPEELVHDHPQTIFYFDMKMKDLESADKLVAIIKKYGIENSSILANSHFPLIFYVEWKYPEINTALEGFDAGKEWAYYLMPKQLKPDFLSGFAAKLDLHQLQWLKKKNLIHCRIVYGVDAQSLPKVLAWGIKNVILDYDSTLTQFDFLKWDRELSKTFYDQFPHSSVDN